MQNTVNPVANTQIVLEWLHVNIGRALDDGLPDNLVHKFYHGCFGIVRVQVGADFAILENLEGAVGFQNLVEGLGPHSVKRFHGTEHLSARDQDPFRRFLQELTRKLPTDRIKQIVSRQDDRIFLHLYGQNVMLKNKSTWQNR